MVAQGCQTGPCADVQGGGTPESNRSRYILRAGASLALMPSAEKQRLMGLAETWVNANMAFIQECVFA